jgi:malic enzyme
VPSFNDDIQGTAAVVLAGLLAALRITGESLVDQRIVYVGAGAAGAGIGRLMAKAMVAETGDVWRVGAAQVFVDSQGLLFEGRAITDEHKRALALSHDVLAQYGFAALGEHRLLDVVAKVKPTVLIGTTAHPGMFTEDVLREMARHVERPIVLPLSNPTSKIECTPDEAFRWMGGRAIVATGTAFEPVTYQGQRHVIGQANNVFIFPGVGLGCILSQARVIDDDVFLAAAQRLATLVSHERLEIGAIYPDQSELRTVSARVAEAVIREVRRKQNDPEAGNDGIAELVSNAMWYPTY